MLDGLGKKEKLLLGIALFAGILYLYINFLFLPSINSVYDKLSSMDNYNGQIQKIEEARKSSVKLKASLETLQTEFIKNSKQLPTSERIPEVARNIKPLVDGNHLIFGPISFGKGAEYLFTLPGTPNSAKASNSNQIAARVMSFPVSHSETGDFINIMKFIDNIETNDKGTRLTEIDNVSFSGTGSSVQTSIAMHYYFATTAKDSELKYDFVTGSYGTDNFFK